MLVQTASTHLATKKSGKNKLQLLLEDKKKKKNKKRSSYQHICHTNVQLLNILKLPEDSYKFNVMEFVQCILLDKSAFYHIA